MKRNLLFLGVVVITSILYQKPAAAVEKKTYDHFVCTCLATGPGYEEGVNIDKICSYDCSCLAFTEGQAPDMNVKAVVSKVKSTAYSRESWDQGSHICHGQYAYRPQLDSPNWKIEVRFSPFRITSEGDLIHEETALIAQGINYELKRTPKAPEIVQDLRRQLSK